MKCQMPVGNEGRICLREFGTLTGYVSERGYYELTGMGDYVRHLIKEHWELLVKVHDAMESGEI